MVRKERLELSHLAAPEPKSGASTNFAISAAYSLNKPNVIDSAYLFTVSLSLTLQIMAGLPGFEPGDGGIKSRCLTAWR